MLAFLGETYAQAQAIPLPVARPVCPARGEDAEGAERAAAPATVSRALTTELASAIYMKDDVAAARHLLRVAAGLESMVVGEAQILGQVKDALTAAEAAGTIGEELRAVFVAAIKAGKRVRAETEIGRADVSVAALAVHVARESLGGLEGKTALVIGAGRTSQLSARLLRANGIGTWCSLTARWRRRKRWRRRSRRKRSRWMRWVLDWAGAARHQRHRRAASCPQRGDRRGGHRGQHASLVMIDLAVPADIEAAAGVLSHVSLYTLDTLRSWRRRQWLALPLTRAILSYPNRSRRSPTRSESSATWNASTYAARPYGKMVPGIAALRRHVDRSERAEMARALERLAHLSAEDQAIENDSASGSWTRCSITSSRVSVRSPNTMRCRRRSRCRCSNASSPIPIHP